MEYLMKLVGLVVSERSLGVLFCFWIRRAVHFVRRLYCRSDSYDRYVQPVQAFDRVDTSRMEKDGPLCALLISQEQCLETAKSDVVDHFRDRFILVNGYD